GDAEEVCSVVIESIDIGKVEGFHRVSSRGVVGVGGASDASREEVHSIRGPLDLITVEPVIGPCHAIPSSKCQDRVPQPTQVELERDKLAVAVVASVCQSQRITCRVTAESVERRSLIRSGKYHIRYGEVRGQRSLAVIHDQIITSAIK